MQQCSVDLAPFNPSDGSTPPPLAVVGVAACGHGGGAAGRRCCSSVNVTIHTTPPSRLRFARSPNAVLAPFRPTAANHPASLPTRHHHRCCRTTTTATAAATIAAAANTTANATANATATPTCRRAFGKEIDCDAGSSRAHHLCKPVQRYFCFPLGQLCHVVREPGQTRRCATAFSVYPKAMAAAAATNMHPRRVVLLCAPGASEALQHSAPKHIRMRSPLF